MENIIGKLVKHQGCSQPRKARQECFARISEFSLSTVGVIAWRSTKENTQPLPGPAGTGTHTHT